MPDQPTTIHRDEPSVPDDLVDVYSAAVRELCNAAHAAGASQPTVRESIRAGLDAATADLRREVADLRAVIALGYDVARAATERWKAEDPDGRKDVLFADAGSLFAWLMAEVDKARAERDQAAARALRDAAAGFAAEARRLRDEAAMLDRNDPHRASRTAEAFGLDRAAGTAETLADEASAGRPATRSETGTAND